MVSPTLSPLGEFLGSQITPCSGNPLDLKTKLAAWRADTLPTTPPHHPKNVQVLRTPSRIGCHLNLCRPSPLNDSGVVRWWSPCRRSSSSAAAARRAALARKLAAASARWSLRYANWPVGRMALGGFAGATRTAANPATARPFSPNPHSSPGRDGVIQMSRVSMQ